MEGQETKWKIVGTYVLTGNVGIPRLYVNYEYISELIGRPGQIFSVRVLTDKHDPATQQKISEEIQAIYDKRGIQHNTPTLGFEFVRDNRAQTDIFVYFMMVMAILIAVVGGLGLAGTMSINVMERTREIGVMRAIGASNDQPCANRRTVRECRPLSQHCPALVVQEGSPARSTG